MIVAGYCILEPGADRPYFSHNPPTEYVRKKGAKVLIFQFDVPDFDFVDGRVAAIARETE